VTVYVQRLLGRQDQPRFAARRVVAVMVAWDEAGRRRLRRTAEDESDVAIDLEHGGYLADGTVLDDDGERILVVRRTSEPALVIRLDLCLPPERLLAQALVVGHAFGNQHVPIDLEDREIRVPLTTSETVARGTVEGLSLEGAAVSVEDVALGKSRPLAGGRGHTHH
jgi:urease accessory protein